jgi:hypothetical protein
LCPGRSVKAESDEEEKVVVVTAQLDRRNDADEKDAGDEQRHDGKSGRRGQLGFLAANVFKMFSP